LPRHPDPLYWQEKACRNPPPGAVGDAVEPLVSVMIVPAETWFVLPVLVQLFPAEDVVLQEMIELPIVHVSEVVKAVTLARIHVVEAPVHE